MRIFWYNAKEFDCAKKLWEKTTDTWTDNDKLLVHHYLPLLQEIHSDDSLVFLKELNQKLQTKKIDLSQVIDELKIQIGQSIKKSYPIATEESKTYQKLINKTSSFNNLVIKKNYTKLKEIIVNSNNIHTSLPILLRCLMIMIYCSNKSKRTDNLASNHNFLKGIDINDSTLFDQLLKILNDSSLHLVNQIISLICVLANKHQIDILDFQQKQFRNNQLNSINANVELTWEYISHFNNPIVNSFQNYGNLFQSNIIPVYDQNGLVHVTQSQSQYHYNCLNKPITFQYRVISHSSITWRIALKGNHSERKNLLSLETNEEGLAGAYQIYDSIVFNQLKNAITMDIIQGKPLFYYHYSLLNLVENELRYKCYDEYTYQDWLLLLIKNRNLAQKILEKNDNLNFLNFFKHSSDCKFKSSLHQEQYTQIIQLLVLFHHYRSLDNIRKEYNPSYHLILQWIVYLHNLSKKDDEIAKQLITAEFKNPSAEFVSSLKLLNKEETIMFLTRNLEFRLQAPIELQRLWVKYEYEMFKNSFEKLQYFRNKNNKNLQFTIETHNHMHFLNVILFEHYPQNDKKIWNKISVLPENEFFYLVHNNQIKINQTSKFIHRVDLLRALNDLFSFQADAHQLQLLEAALLPNNVRQKYGRLFVNYFIYKELKKTKSKADLPTFLMALIKFWPQIIFIIDDYTAYHAALTSPQAANIFLQEQQSNISDAIIKTGKIINQDQELNIYLHYLKVGSILPKIHLKKCDINFFIALFKKIISLDDTDLSARLSNVILNDEFFYSRLLIKNNIIDEEIINMIIKKCHDNKIYTQKVLITLQIVIDKLFTAKSEIDSHEYWRVQKNILNAQKQHQIYFVQRDGLDYLKIIEKQTSPVFIAHILEILNEYLKYDERLIYGTDRQKFLNKLYLMTGFYYERSINMKNQEKLTIKEIIKYPQLFSLFLLDNEFVIKISNWLCNIKYLLELSPENFFELLFKRAQLEEIEKDNKYSLKSKGLYLSFLHLSVRTRVVNQILLQLNSQQKCIMLYTANNIFSQLKAFVDKLIANANLDPWGLFEINTEKDKLTFLTENLDKVDGNTLAEILLSLKETAMAIENSRFVIQRLTLETKPSTFYRLIKWSILYKSEGNVSINEFLQKLKMSLLIHLNCDENLYNIISKMIEDENITLNDDEFNKSNLDSVISFLKEPTKKQYLFPILSKNICNKKNYFQQWCNDFIIASPDIRESMKTDLPSVYDFCENICYLIRSDSQQFLFLLRLADIDNEFNDFIMNQTLLTNQFLIDWSVTNFARQAHEYIYFIRQQKSPEKFINIDYSYEYRDYANFYAIIFKKLFIDVHYNHYSSDPLSNLIHTCISIVPPSILINLFTTDAIIKNEWLLEQFIKNGAIQAIILDGSHYHYKIYRYDQYSRQIESLIESNVIVINEKLLEQIDHCDYFRRQLMFCPEATKKLYLSADENTRNLLKKSYPDLFSHLINENEKYNFSFENQDIIQLLRLLDLYDNTYTLPIQSSQQNLQLKKGKEKIKENEQENKSDIILKKIFILLENDSFDQSNPILKTIIGTRLVTYFNKLFKAFNQSVFSDASPLHIQYLIDRQKPLQILVDHIDCRNMALLCIQLLSYNEVAKKNIANVILVNLKDQISKKNSIFDALIDIIIDLPDNENHYFHKNIITFLCHLVSSVELFLPNVLKIISYCSAVFWIFFSKNIFLNENTIEPFFNLVKNLSIDHNKNLMKLIEAITTQQNLNKKTNSIEILLPEMSLKDKYLDLIIKTQHIPLEYTYFPTTHKLVKGFSNFYLPRSVSLIKRTHDTCFFRIHSKLNESMKNEQENNFVGSFGRVKPVLLVEQKRMDRQIYTKEIRALKIFYPDWFYEIKIKNEIRYWNLFSESHGYNIIQLEDKRKKIYLDMPWVYGENLLKISNQQNKLNCHTRFRIILSGLNALENLHEIKKIIHRDIKPQNIIYDSFSYESVFPDGESYCPFNESKAQNFIGTLIYRAPELRDMKIINYSTATDIYAFGLTMLEVFGYILKCESENYDGNDDDFAFCESENTKRIKNYSLFCEYVKENILCSDPTKRHTLEQIKKNLIDNFPEAKEQYLVLERTAATILKDLENYILTRWDAPVVRFFGLANNNNPDARKKMMPKDFLKIYNVIKNVNSKKISAQRGLMEVMHIGHEAALNQDSRLDQEHEPNYRVMFLHFQRGLIQSLRRRVKSSDASCADDAVKVHSRP